MSVVQESWSDPLLWSWDGAKCIICVTWWSIAQCTCSHVKSKVFWDSSTSPLFRDLLSPLCFHTYRNTAQISQPERSQRFLVPDTLLCGLSWRDAWCTHWQISSTTHPDYIDPVIQRSLFSFKNWHQLPSICIISLLTTKKASGKVLQQSLDNGWEA